MRTPTKIEELDVYVWEGKADIVDRVARCMASFDVEVIRADDIATDNTVSSTRVADARITYSGTGSFADASQPGWLDRFFLSPLWPF
jgi:hypothetical protein